MPPLAVGALRGDLDGEIFAGAGDRRPPCAAVPASPPLLPDEPSLCVGEPARRSETSETVDIVLYIVMAQYSCGPI